MRLSAVPLPALPPLALAFLLLLLGLKDFQALLSRFGLLDQLRNRQAEINVRLSLRLWLGLWLRLGLRLWLRGWWRDDLRRRSWCRFWCWLWHCWRRRDGCRNLDRRMMIVIAVIIVMDHMMRVSAWCHVTGCQQDG